jgi:hypothetical protein
MAKKNYYPVINVDRETDPFESVEELWFWFVAANQAQLDGARIGAGASEYNRPCLPSDIFTILNRLHRNRRLLREHLLVLRHYGKRQLAPDPHHPKEARAASIWKEAMEALEDILISKGIVLQPKLWPELSEFYDMYDTLDNGDDENLIYAMRAQSNTTYTECGA